MRQSLKPTARRWNAPQDLVPHAAPARLSVAVASVAAGDLDETSLEVHQALAVADYLSRSIRDYPREVRWDACVCRGRTSAAGIDNAGYAPIIRRQSWQATATLRERAAQNYAIAAQALPGARRSEQRHLLVLAALG